MRQSLLVSLIAHFLVLTAVALWPQRSMPRRSTTITIQQLQLRPPVEPEVKAQPPPRVEPPPPKLEKKPPERLIARNKIRDLLKKRLRTPKPIPTRAPTRAPRKTTPTPLRKRATPTPTLDRKIVFQPFKDVQPTPETPVAQPEEPKAEPNELLTFEEGFDYQGYTDRLMRSLQNNWDRPAWQPRREEGIYALICFTIRDNGVIVNAYVERSSGWDDLDKSALQAVRRSSPAEPLPPAYRRPSVRAHVRFIPIPR